MSRLSQGAPRLRPFQRDVLVGRGVGEAGYQPKPRLSDARANAVDEGELPDRRVDRPFVDDLLHLVQDRLAFLVIELDRLLLVQLVEVGVAAVDENSALDDVSLEAGCGVAKGARTRLNDVLERLFGVPLDEGCPLDRPKFRANSDRL